jgi:PAT family beta-lactamase induction signal transducer AmpG
MGHSVPFLAFTIGVENFTSAMGNAAFMAYLSSLCTLSFTASQYALLSAVASFGRTFFSASAGWLAEATSWPMFFVLSSVVAIPGILALLWLMRLTLRQNAPFEPIRTT